MKHSTTSAAVLLLIALCASPAQASDPAPTGERAPFTPLYTGAFVAMGAFAGPSHTTMRSLESAWSASYGAWAQLSIPLQILDFQGAYFRNDASTTFTDGRGLQFGQDTLSFAAAIHPAFLLFLESDTFNDIVAGTYFLIGSDVERVTASFEDGQEVSEFDIGLQLGAGLDFPLDNYQDGGAFWLGVQYRFNQYDFETNPLRNLDVRQHLFFIRLSYRRNGLFIAI